MKKLLSIFLAAALLLMAAGCGNKDVPSNKNPVTITIWHTYVENMREAFDELVREFNNTVGAENGITVKVTSITDASIVNEQLIAAANKDPGAPQMPDMAVIYPQIAVTLLEKGAIADVSQYFTQSEIDEFVPQFIEEGRLGTDGLYLIPVAKSSEVLYVNRTLFDRFSNATGIGIDMLETFEGIAEAALAYYQWTDDNTPDIPNDGKMFYFPEGLFNHAMIGYQQLGSDIVSANRLALNEPIFERIWDCYFKPAVMGGTIIYSGWSNYLAATGDIVCAIATSAGASFYPTSITYADNTKEDVEFDVLPYPVYEGGDNVAFQRGGGICVFESEPVREYAACLFLKWFTQAEQNLRFCANTGYMPVRNEAFDLISSGNLPTIDDPMIEKSMRTVAAMQQDYRFYFPPVFDGFDVLQNQYADRMRQAALSGRDVYLELNESRGDASAFDAVYDGAMDDFIRGFVQ